MTIIFGHSNSLFYVLFFSMKNRIVWALIGSLLTIMVFVTISQIDKQKENDQKNNTINMSFYNIINSWTQIDEVSDDAGKEWFIPLNRYRIYNRNKQYFLWISQTSVFIALDKNYQWIPWITIKDTAIDTCHLNNKPMALTIKDGNLLLSVLDSCGAGSMDGYISALALQVDWKRKVEKCYNYNNWGIFEQEAIEKQLQNDRYARGTIQFDKLKEVSLETCKDNIEVLYSI